MDTKLSLRPRGVVLGVAAALAAVLAWRVIATALDAQAEQHAGWAASAAAAPLGAEGADRVWRERLAHNPADATAMLVLAFELERQGRTDEAAAAVNQALRLAPKDAQMLLQGVGFFLRSGNEAQALLTLREAIESSSGGVNASVWKVFSAALDSGRHKEFFDAIARDDPAWWPGFFREACERGANSAGIQAVFASRVEAGVFTGDEVRCMIARLQRDGEWTRAYQTWLNTLPLDQRQRVGYVFNGSFEYPLSNLGFDWLVPSQDGVAVLSMSTDGANGRAALAVTFANRRLSAPPVQQYLMLVPGGRYRLEGRAHTELDAWLGLQWGLYCNDGAGREQRSLTHSDRFVGVADWKDFRQEFAVPDDCPVQILRLEVANPRRESSAPGASAARLKGRAWFDDLRVRILD